MDNLPILKKHLIEKTGDFNSFDFFEELKRRQKIDQRIGLFKTEWVSCRTWDSKSLRID